MPAIDRRSFATPLDTASALRVALGAMASPQAPLWLNAPSRFAALRRPRARLVLALFALLLALCLTALFVAEPPVPADSGASAEQTDLALYERIVAGVRGHENYYRVAADAMRAGHYPLRPFLTMRLPALATLLAAIPVWAATALLFGLAASVAYVWAVRIGQALARPAPRFLAAILLLGSLLAFLQPGLIAFHEIWAGLLVALSLGLRRQGRWIEPVALALAAMLIRETAALYALVMLAAAWREGETREARGWAGALLLFAIALAAHAWAVTGVTGPLDPASPGWSGLLGPGFFVKSLTLSTALQLVPLWLGALIVGLAIAGWASWNDPAATRMLAILAAYAVAISLFARLDTFYWALMVAPLLLPGLVFLPDALRDLFARTLDRSRITVTRVMR